MTSVWLDSLAKWIHFPRVNHSASWCVSKLTCYHDMHCSVLYTNGQCLYSGNHCLISICVSWFNSMLPPIWLAVCRYARDMKGVLLWYRLFNADYSVSKVDRTYMTCTLLIMTIPLFLYNVLMCLLLISSYTKAHMPSVLWNSWEAGGTSGTKKLVDELLVWLSVWVEVQMVCIWSSWCTATPSSLASLKSRIGSAFLALA